MYGRHHDLDDRYPVSVSQFIYDISELFSSTYTWSDCWVIPIMDLRKGFIWARTLLGTWRKPITNDASKQSNNRSHDFVTVSLRCWIAPCNYTEVCATVSIHPSPYHYRASSKTDILYNDTASIYDSGMFPDSNPGIWELIGFVTPLYFSLYNP